jgi:hypothetical protein
LNIKLSSPNFITNIEKGLFKVVTLQTGETKKKMSEINGRQVVLLEKNMWSFLRLVNTKENNDVF